MKRDNYTNEEYYDVLTALGMANEIAAASRELYLQRFPWRRVPDDATFRKTFDTLIRT